MMYDAVILAGGLGTRLRVVSPGIPKALVELAGEPFVAHQLRLLRRNGVGRVVLCVGYLGEMIQETIGDGARYGVAVDYSFDGPVLLGTGGAVRNALPLLGTAFLVLYGDSYLDCDYRAVQQAFDVSGRSALMTVFRNEQKWGRSNVEFAGGRILRHDKKKPRPEMKHIDYGLGVFRRSVFERLEAPRAYDLSDVYGRLLRENDLAAYEVTRRFYEIGTQEGLEETRAYLARLAVLKHT